jgi:hypothetical protein
MREGIFLYEVVGEKVFVEMVGLGEFVGVKVVLVLVLDLAFEI